MIPTLKYSRRARAYHWITAVLLTVAYASIYLRKLFERGSAERTFASESHFMVGLAILLLVLPRLMSRLKEARPLVVPAEPRWTIAVAQVTHGLLYAFLIVQPLLGLVTRLAEGKGVGLPFTDRVIPSFFGKHEELAHQLESVHIWLGEAFYWVIGLHIVAALWHWVVRRDNLMQRMT